MAVSFAGHPLFGPGFSAPGRFEADVFDCEVEGELPEGLHGGFYRLQCDFAYPPPANEWASGFNGDGHVSRFWFEGGRAHYRGRYVRTERLMAERAAGRRLFGVYRNRLTDQPEARGLNRSAANTNLVWHAGRMLALKEDALPYEIDPHTLETIGPYDYAGALTGETFSAHPKLDVESGRMLAYGYQAKGDLSDDVVFYDIGADGRIARELWLKAPYPGIMHDIAVTERHVLLPVVPMTTSRQRLEAGEPMWAWDDSLPTMVGVFPRDGDARDVRWFRGPARLTLHFLNAVSEGDVVRMELPVSDGPGAPSQIRRWSFDLNSGDDRFGEERVAGASSPLARIDDRYLGHPYRTAFVGHQDADRPMRTDLMGRAAGFAANCWQRIDVGSGDVRSFFAGDVVGLQECCFVPRRPDAPEGDGWLVGVASNYERQASDLIIADAERMELVATVRLPFRLRSGTHGIWAGAEDLPPRPQDSAT
jgi:carotenoid cleavage dioxygenase